MGLFPPHGPITTSAPMMQWPKPDPDQGPATGGGGLLPGVRIKQEVLSDEEPEQPMFSDDFFNGHNLPRCKGK